MPMLDSRSFALAAALDHRRYMHPRIIYAMGRVTPTMAVPVAMATLVSHLPLSLSKILPL